MIVDQHKRMMDLVRAGRELSTVVRDLLLDDARVERKVGAPILPPDYRNRLKLAMKKWEQS